MSRVGKKPILIPANVQVSLAGQNLTVKGPKGELSFEVSPDIAVAISGNQIVFSIKPESISKVSTSKQKKAMKSVWGSSRNIINNLIEGVVSGFEKKLEFEGVGYRAEVKDGDLSMFLGFTHPVIVKKAGGINFSVDKNIITVSGIDKKLVGQVASTIKAKKIPDPYKAKGIKYLGEVIKRKAGKKAAGATTTGK